MFTKRSKQDSIFTEKRKHRRYSLSVPLFYWSSTKELRPKWVLTRDISQNGIRFQTDSSITKGTIVRMEIEIPGRLFLVKALGRVRWVKVADHPDNNTQSSQKQEIGLHIVFSKPFEAVVWRKYIHRSTALPSLSN